MLRSIILAVTLVWVMPKVSVQISTVGCAKRTEMNAENRPLMMLRCIERNKITLI